MDNDLDRIFSRKNLRLTAPRRGLFEVLQSAKEPLSIAELAKACAHIDRVSIYRTVSLFESLNIVRSVPVGWKQKYELTTPFKAHHHHLYCSGCGLLIDVHSTDFEKLVADVATEHGFMPQDHTFEIKGLCKNCR